VISLVSQVPTGLLERKQIARKPRREPVLEYCTVCGHVKNVGFQRCVDLVLFDTC